MTSPQDMKDMKKVTVEWLLQNRAKWRTSDDQKESVLPAAYMTVKNRAITHDGSGSLMQIHQINENEGQYTLWNMLSFGNDYHDLHYPCTLQTEVYLKRPATGYHAKNWKEYPKPNPNIKPPNKGQS